MEARMQKEEARHKEFMTQLDLQISKDGTDHEKIMEEIEEQKALVIKSKMIEYELKS